MGGGQPKAAHAPQGERGLQKEWQVPAGPIGADLVLGPPLSAF